jgi:hypothetical protein
MCKNDKLDAAYKEWSKTPLVRVSQENNLEILREAFDAGWEAHRRDVEPVLEEIRQQALDACTKLSGQDR